MQDRRTHGLLTTKPPAQTYCGLDTYGRKATADPFAVDCEDCKRNMRIAGVLPDLQAPIEPRGRGRPRGSTKKRSLFGL
jgi:hypothetical protein